MLFDYVSFEKKKKNGFAISNLKFSQPWFLYEFSSSKDLKKRMSERK